MTTARRPPRALPSLLLLALLVPSACADDGAAADVADRKDTQTILNEELLHRLHVVTKNDEVAAAINAGASVAARDPGGNTPLMLAASKGLGGVVQLLLDRGADVDAVNKQGLTALHAAAHRGYSSIVDTLLDAGADVTVQNAQGATALSMARDQDSVAHPEVVKMLEAGARPRKPRSASSSAAAADSSATATGPMARLRRNFGARDADGPKEEL